MVYPPGPYAMCLIAQPIPQAVIANKWIVGVYLQFTWNMIEKTKHHYTWTLLDARIAEATAAGLKVVLSNRLSLFSAPNYVKNDPATQTIALLDTNPNHATYGQELVLPVFWDGIYQGAKQTFIQALGARYANNPAVVGVRGSFANYYTDDWAMPHYVGSFQGEEIDQVQQWLDAGWDSRTMRGVGESIIQATSLAFPNQAIKLPLGVTDARLDGSLCGLAEQVANHGYGSYFPERFFIQMNSLSNQTHPANDSKVSGATPDGYSYLFKLLLQRTPQIGLQMLSASPNVTEAQNAVNVGLTYKPKFMEFWGADASDPSLAGAIQAAAQGMGSQPRS